MQVATGSLWQRVKGLKSGGERLKRLFQIPEEGRFAHRKIDLSIPLYSQARYNGTQEVVGICSV
jgi:hypothetical protein